MRRRRWGLLPACLMPVVACADELGDGLTTLWEVLWHQSGIPTRVLRWDSDIRVRFTGLNVAAHRDHMLEALLTVTGEANNRLIDVTGKLDEQSANLTVEVTSDNRLDDNQPCVTYLNF